MVFVDGHRTIIIDPSFFTGYRKVKMEANEVVISVEIPFTSEVENWPSTLLILSVLLE